MIPNSGQALLTIKMYSFTILNYRMNPKLSKDYCKDGQIINSLSGHLKPWVH